MSQREAVGWGLYVFGAFFVSVAVGTAYHDVNAAAGLIGGFALLAALMNTLMGIIKGLR